MLASSLRQATLRSWVVSGGGMMTSAIKGRSMMRRRTLVIVAVLLVATTALSVAKSSHRNARSVTPANAVGIAWSASSSSVSSADAHALSPSARSVATLASNVVLTSPVTNDAVSRQPALRIRRYAHYPVGRIDAAQPSGRAPPASGAMAGFRLIYQNGFTGDSLPSGWVPYSGVPSGDAGGQFSPSHVVVNNGLLTLNTWQDPSFNNEWVTGGLCQCGVARTYGAYFVRSRVTGAGPTAVELLWPVAHVWPPEIDFSETGGQTSSSSATLHFASANQFVQRQVSVDMTQWHTWGVIWTPTSVLYTVDGKIWGEVNASTEVPHQPMTLDLQQQTWCAAGWACPTTPQSLQVDWVAEYAPA